MIAGCNENHLHGSASTPGLLLAGIHGHTPTGRSRSFLHRTTESPQRNNYCAGANSVSKVQTEWRSKRQSGTGHSAQITNAKNPTSPPTLFTVPSACT